MRILGLAVLISVLSGAPLEEAVWTVLKIEACVVGGLLLLGGVILWKTR